MAITNNLLSTLIYRDKNREAGLSVKSSPSNKSVALSKDPGNAKSTPGVSQGVVLPEFETALKTGIATDFATRAVNNAATASNPLGIDIASSENEELLTGEEGPKLTPGAENLRRAISNFGRSNTFRRDVGSDPLTARTNLAQGVLQNIIPAAIQAKAEKTAASRVSAEVIAKINAKGKNKRQIIKRDVIDPNNPLNIRTDIFNFDPLADPGQSLQQLDVDAAGRGGQADGSFRPPSEAESKILSDRSSLNAELLRRSIIKQKENNL